jgi:hypothetical protein
MARIEIADWRSPPVSESGGGPTRYRRFLLFAYPLAETQVKTLLPEQAGLHVPVRQDLEVLVWDGSGNERVLIEVHQGRVFRARWYTNRGSLPLADTN